VLAVVHFSHEVFGKWRVDLLLRQALLERAMRVGQIGSAYHAELFGMDHSLSRDLFSPTFPVQIVRSYTSALVGSAAFDSSGKAVELIVIGVDGSISDAKAMDSSSTLSLFALSCLLGANPEALVVALNEFDHFEEVAPRISAIREVAHAPLLGVIQSSFFSDCLPINMTEAIVGGTAEQIADRLVARASQLKTQFSVDTFNFCNPCEVQKLTDLIVSYFHLPVINGSLEGGTYARA
jgi:hypothetical protein